MLSEEIDNSELLFRAVPDKPQMWKEKEGRPSSAIFKDSQGVSVDRDGNRTDAQVTENFKKRFSTLKAIVSIEAEECRDAGAFLQYDPLPDNFHHSLILNSQDSIQVKSSGKARRLTKLTKIVYFKD